MRPRDFIAVFQRSSNCPCAGAAPCARCPQDPSRRGPQSAKRCVEGFIEPQWTSGTWPSFLAAAADTLLRQGIMGPLPLPPLPPTPGRGRSRLSKHLPSRPAESPDIPIDTKDLPALPSKATNASMGIPRRPVGRDLTLPERTTSLANALPPTEEIWRRRSARREKSKSLSFDLLKLSQSNGSTSSAPPRQQEQSTGLPRSKSYRKAFSFLGSRAAPEPDLMGSKVTKLKKKKDEGPAQRPLPPPPLQQHAAGPRPPASGEPFTPPDDDPPPMVPQKPESRFQSSSESSTGSDATIIAPTTLQKILSASPRKENLHPSSGHSRQLSQLSDTITITSQPTVRSPRPQKPQAAVRVLTSKLPPTPPPPNEPSPPRSPTSHQPRLVSPEGRAQPFPTMQSQAPLGFIFPAPALDRVHFDCYQSHQLMRRTNNSNYPVACMVCQRKDTKDRWRCAWCYLSACGSCMQVLSQVPGKDLRVCLERLGNGHA